MQYTSKTPPSRGELAQLHEALDQRLVQRQANDSGICPVRSELYSQLFGALSRARARAFTPSRRPRALTLSAPPRAPADELIRQVTLDLPERGLLLLRLRDESRMTIDAYKTLYDASVTFGVRKQLQAEQGIPELEAEVAAWGEKKKALEAQMLSLRNKLENVERRLAAKRTLDEKRRKEEIGYLKHEGKHLEAFVKNMGR